jgi:hypothetical protein
MINYCIDNEQYKKEKRDKKKYTLTKSEIAIFMKLTMPEKEKYI